MKILFICYANVCRSFMAQELCSKLWPEAEVFSRGLYADPQFHIPAKVLNFLKSRQIVPSLHLSTQLKEEDLERADYIFCMEQRHLDMLTDRYAQYSQKMWLLSDFAFDKETDLDDPIGLEGAAFVKQAQLLQKAVTACVQRLKKTN